MNWYVQWLEQGTPWSYVLLAGQCVLIAILIERSVYLLVRTQVNLTLFFAAIKKLVTAGEVERAQRLAAALNAPAGRVCSAGLSGLGRGPFWLREELDRVIAAEGPRIRRRLRGLPLLSLALAGVGVVGSALLGGASAFGADGPLPFGLAQELASAFVGVLSAVVGLLGWLLLSNKATQIQTDLTQCRDFILELDTPAV